MLSPVDGSLALLLFALSLLVTEMLLAHSQWRATPRNRAMLAIPLWAVAMATYTVFRLAISWATF